MKPYCLRCFIPLQGDDRTCPDCGFVSIRPLRMRYWNQHPGIIALENTFKGGIVFVCLATIILILVNLERGAGSAYSGYAIAFPVVAVGVGLWQTASRLTRRNTYFGPVLFWALAFGLLCLLFLFIDFRLSLAFLIPLVFVYLIGKSCSQWKRKKIASRGVV
jgi:hypothetical protein